MWWPLRPRCTTRCRLHRALVGQRLPEVGHQFAVELADLGRGELGLEDEKRPAAQVDGAGGQRLFHGQRELAVAADAGAVAQGLADGLAQADAHVLDRVVLIDLQVAGGLDGQIEGRVLGQQREHVIEEADAGGDLRLAAAVQHSSSWIFVSAVLRSIVAVRAMSVALVKWELSVTSVAHPDAVLP